MIESPKNFIEQFQNFIEHIAGLMKTFLTKEVADNYYLGKTDKAISAGTADTAGTAIKATQDTNGNAIPETYATKAELTSGLATKQPVGDYRTKSELDSIYLGINAKAKSAEVADVAQKVNSLIGATPILSTTQAPVTVSVESRKASASWTAPDYGLFVGYINLYSVNSSHYGSLYFRGKEIYKIRSSSFGKEELQVNVNWALKAGDVIMSSTTWTGTFSDPTLQIKGTFYPWDFLETPEE